MSAGKFEQNRNKFRRVYGFGGRPRPNIQTYTDANTGTQHQRDFNQIIRFRDYYKVGDHSSFVAPVQYAENLVAIVPGQTSYTVSFPFTFNAIPIVTVQAEPTFSASAVNINSYITSITQGSFTFGISAPPDSITGLRWKAISLSVATFGSFAVYPAAVQRTPLFPGVFATASAGMSTITNISAVTMSFNSVGGTPVEWSTSPSENNSKNNQSDIFISQSVLAISSANVELSAPFTGDIEFIALNSAAPAITFAPPTGSLIAWYSADMMVTQSAGLVIGWGDRSGNGWILSNNVDFPTYNVFQQNGLPTIRFDGVNDSMLTAVNFLPTGNRAHTIIMMCIPRGATAFDGFASVGNGSNPGGLSTSILGIVNTRKIWYGGQNDGTSVGANTQTFGTPLILVKTFDGANVVGYFNGLNDLSGDPVTYALGGTQFLVGGYIWTGAALFGPGNFDVGEILVWSRALTALEILTVNTYLTQRWSVY